MNAAANPNILALRPDFRAIARWVEPNSTVLDLGCGDGSLLRVLQDELSVQAYGVEIRDEGVLSCAQKGVHVIQQDTEGGLKLFEDKSFDTVILSQTLQTIHNTAQVLRDTRCAWDASASCPSPTSATGRTGCRCSAAACRCQSRCPTSGTTPPTCAC